jgi:hypothetical protein
LVFHSEGKYRLRVFENKALRKIFGTNREEEAVEKFIMRTFIICSLHERIAY